MAITKHDALMSLKPNEGWSWAGFDYKDLNWEGKSTKPTESELNTKVAELDAAEPMRLLREERNQLLSETDWMVTRSIETGVAMSNDWKTYRQALRDLPASSSPSLDEYYDLDLTSVTWPTEPS